MDTGVGIAPEDKQLGKDSSRKPKATGLGLALTKRLVELHGGQIRRRQGLDLPGLATLRVLKREESDAQRMPRVQRLTTAHSAPPRRAGSQQSSHSCQLALGQTVKALGLNTDECDDSRSNPDHRRAPAAQVARTPLRQRRVGRLATPIT